MSTEVSCARRCVKRQAVEIVRKGGVIVYRTDSGYALGCKIEDKGAMERICR
ncbi:Sua5/YciO/YrdC/YwlC family protein, partial [Enterobacter hormaechei]